MAGATAPRVAWCVGAFFTVASLVGCKQRESVASVKDAVASGGDGRYGVHFVGCPNINAIESDMKALFARLGLLDKVKTHREGGGDSADLWFGIEESNTLSIADDTQKWNAPPDRFHFTWIWDEYYVKEPEERETSNPVSSQKEILIALLMKGRALTLTKQQCHVNALIEHVQVRQSIAEMGAVTQFTFPQGTGARFYKKFWEKNIVVKKDARTSDAMFDAIYRRGYSMGCTAAVKVMMTAGIYSYYRWGNAEIGASDQPNFRNETKGVLERSQGSASSLEENSVLNAARAMVLESLEKDKDPIANIIPEEEVPGSLSSKILNRARGVTWDNWIPGDWGYILNGDLFTADPEKNVWKNQSSRLSPDEKKFAISEFQGLEGTNILYLGRGYFASYYVDDEHGSQDLNLPDFLWRDYQWRWEYGDRVGREFAKNNPTVATREAARFDILRNSPIEGQFPCEGYYRANDGTFGITYQSEENEKKLRLHPRPCGMLATERDAPRVLGDYSKAISDQVAAEKNQREPPPASAIPSVPNNSTSVNMSMTMKNDGTVERVAVPVPKSDLPPIAAAPVDTGKFAEIAKANSFRTYNVKLQPSSDWPGMSARDQLTNLRDCARDLVERMDVEDTGAIDCRVKRTAENSGYWPTVVCLLPKSLRVDLDESCFDEGISDFRHEVNDRTYDRFAAQVSLFPK